MVELLEFVIYLTLASTVAFFSYLAYVVWRTFYLEYRELVRFREGNECNDISITMCRCEASRASSFLVLPISVWGVDKSVCACGVPEKGKKSAHSMETLAAE